MVHVETTVMRYGRSDVFVQEGLGEGREAGSVE